MMMMLFVLNGDNDDRDENGKEERRSRHRPPPLGGASEPPTTAHTNQRYDKSLPTDDNKHDLRGEHLFYFFLSNICNLPFSQLG